MNRLTDGPTDQLTRQVLETRVRDLKEKSGERERERERERELCCGRVIAIVVKWH